MVCRIVAAVPGADVYPRAFQVSNDFRMGKGRWPALSYRILAGFFCVALL